jgi:mRNA interferase RelE/StbE
LAWTIELAETAKKTLGRLDRTAAKRIRDFLRLRLAELENPRQLGKPLHGSLENYWSYRVGDYRILCDLQDNKLIVLVVDIGHRSDVYR